MAKITINPRGGQLFDFNDFEISVQQTNRGSKSIRTTRFGDRNQVEVSLSPGDVIGINYRGIPQNFSIQPRDEEAAGDAFLQFAIRGDQENNDLDLDVDVSLPESLQPHTIENDVDVNIRSLNMKQPIEVKLTTSVGEPTRDQAFWDLINNHKIDFKHYSRFIDEVLSYSPAGAGKSALSKSDKRLLAGYNDEERTADTRRLPFNWTEAYSLLKYATEKYVERVYSLSSHVDDGSERDRFDLEDYLGRDKIIPYYNLIKSKIREYFRNGDGNPLDFLDGRTDVTLIELVWNYWHEEGMVSHAMNALARRFQNIKSGYKDPLANFALDPLRPLNNILWGYIQDTQHRLTPTRRNYEYTSEYDLCVISTLKANFNPADRRSKFLQSFHRLIYEATEYFVQSDNTIIRPDGFKLLNAIRDTHRILAEGAHNQFGDLPTVARIEMLIEQWILARSEVREFLGGRTMVPHEEPWMDRVDSMKALQGWDNTSISFYRDLAVYGEKIILSIRYGNWTVISRRDHATNWADAFRDAIQRYIHSYYTVTGIDLAAPNVNINSAEKYTIPGMLIQRKVARERDFIRRS